MAKLVAFYSRADENYFGGSMKYIQIGNTEKAAKMIADMTGADLFKIEQKIPYAADYNTCIAQAKEDKQTGKRPEILNLPQDIDQYDEIYLGYPNYWGTMPMAVYTFLESYDFTGKKILLVEDNALNLEIAEEILQEEGFAVDTANDGDIAVEKRKDA